MTKNIGNTVSNTKRNFDYNTSFVHFGFALLKQSVIQISPNFSKILTEPIRYSGFTVSICKIIRLIHKLALLEVVDILLKFESILSKFVVILVTWPSLLTSNPKMLGSSPNQLKNCFFFRKMTNFILPKFLRILENFELYDYIFWPKRVFSIIFFCFAQSFNTILRFNFLNKIILYHHTNDPVYIFSIFQMLNDWCTLGCIEKGMIFQIQTAMP
jgi:hypothetical protein